MASEKDKQKREQMRAQLAEKLLTRMEQDGLSWRKDWDANAFLPRNGLRGTRYHGINRAYLAMQAIDEGYADPRWVTFPAARKAGWKVRKGEHGCPIEKWGYQKAMRDPDDPSRLIFPSKRELKDIDPQLLRDILCFERVFYVFNYEQVEGPEPFDAGHAAPEADFKMADDLIASSLCPIAEVASSRAFYSLGEDRIVLPLRSSFDAPAGFTATLIHEMAHSTGHATRLDRQEQMGAWFGTEKYAIEELRAEFASAFVQAELGVDLSAHSVDNHAAYLASWLEACRKDKGVLFSAIADAEKISGFLVDEYEKHVMPERRRDAA